MLAPHCSCSVNAPASPFNPAPSLPRRGARGRYETAMSVRQNAVNPGFHLLARGGGGEGQGRGTRRVRDSWMPNGLAASLGAGRQPVTGVTSYLLYEPKSYSSSGTASPVPWPNG